MKLILAALLPLLLLFNCAYAQHDTIQKDSLPIDFLNPSPHSPLVLPIQQIVTEVKPFGRVDTIQFRRGDDHSIEYGLNTVPGVRFESRGPGGSRRISMRGSLLRSGFGVRGIKAYVDGVPLTGPDGNTPLEVIDAAGLESATVTMGPHSAQYGPGTGGVMHFSTAAAPRFGRNGGSAAFTAGSFGFRRASLALGTVSRSGRLAGSAMYVRERFDGYRAQEGNFKDFLLLKAKRRIDLGWAQGVLHASAWYYDGGWELPGGLDSATRAEAPRSANPYSQQQAQAAVFRKWLQLNVGYEMRSSNWGLMASIYGQGTHKLNPYGTSAANNGYKDESGTGWGMRTHLEYSAATRFIYHLDLEYQLEPARLREYDNIQGRPGAIRLDQQVAAHQGLISAGVSWMSPQALISSYVGLNYLSTNFQDQLLGLPSAQITTPIMPQASLEATIFWNKWSRSLWHAPPRLLLRAASAYSPPSWWEIRQADGSIDQLLNPEQGFNLEAGMQLWPAAQHINRLEVKVYHLALWGAILPYTDSLGLTRYRNAEQCNQTGAELSFQTQVTPSWSVQGSAAWMYYRFAEESRTGDFDKGDAVPGVPTATAFLATEYVLPIHLLLRVSAHFTGPIWLDSHNADRQDAYVVVNTFVEQTLTRKRSGLYEDRASLRLTAGVNNLLDAAYSNYLNLNDRRRNYWNPAPTRNIFAGIQCTF